MRKNKIKWDFIYLMISLFFLGFTVGIWTYDTFLRGENKEEEFIIIFDQIPRSFQLPLFENAKTTTSVDKI